MSVAVHKRNQDKIAVALRNIRIATLREVASNMAAIAAEVEGLCYDDLICEALDEIQESSEIVFGPAMRTSALRAATLLLLAADATSTDQ